MIPQRTLAPQRRGGGQRLPTLSQYYVTSRYPNAGLEVPSEGISRTQAEEALNVAEVIISYASKLLT
ncbi:HEPN domain-containing protein [Caldivirga sp.]|uniref:HEPN domain-containing protein n=1 Tax=Caldivirga sp. TaxID=2080243 RepID=UPI0025B7B3C5|nr:HEPN domain-containing protein [Caldivirga sp.]